MVPSGGSTGVGVRVGFQRFGGTQWAGGFQYLKNLLSALAALPDRPVEATLIVEEPAEQEATAAAVVLTKARVVEPTAA